MESSFNTSLKAAGLTILLDTDPSYAQVYAECVRSSGNLTATELSNKYPKEYSSWQNRKGWAKENNVQWHPDMEPFKGFLSILGPIPHKTWTLDRINPRGAYIPENLRWASKETQSQNRTTARLVDYDGQQLTFKQLSEKTGKLPDTLRRGIKRNGDSYISNLVTNLVTKPKFDASYAAITWDIEKWQWPEETRHQLLTSMYNLRHDYAMTKPRFFLELLTYEISVRDFIREHDIEEENRIEAQKDLDRLRPLLVETQTFIDDINERIYGLREQHKPSIVEDYYLNLIEKVEVREPPCKKPTNPTFEWVKPQPQPLFAVDFPERYAALKKTFEMLEPQH